MRCDWIKIKEHHGQGDRSKRPSTWRCKLELDHGGPHELNPQDHQSNKDLWINRRLKREIVQ